MNPDNPFSGTCRLRLGLPVALCRQHRLPGCPFSRPTAGTTPIFWTTPPCGLPTHSLPRAGHFFPGAVTGADTCLLGTTVSAACPHDTRRDHRDYLPPTTCAAACWYLTNRTAHHVPCQCSRLPGETTAGLKRLDGAPHWRWTLTDAASSYQYAPATLATLPTTLSRLPLYLTA